MEIRKIMSAGLLTMAVLSVTGCGLANPGAGYEAVLVKKPLIFGHGGIDPDPVRTGTTVVALSTEDIYVNMQPVQYNLDLKDIMSSDGVPLEFDAALRLQVTNSVDLISRFGEHWYENNVEKEFYNLVRQEVRKHGMNETAINPTAIGDIDAKVTEGLSDFLTKSNIPVKLISVTVGKANPPDAIKNQRVETAAQQQAIITEQQRKLAQDARTEAEKSRANADNAYRSEMGLSPEQYVQLEKIKMLHDVCSHSACTFLEGTGGTPLVNVK